MLGRPTRTMTRISVLAAAGALGLTACAGAGGGGGGGGGGEEGGGEISVAMVANPQMQDLEKLASEFKNVAPDVTVNFSVLPENEVRDRVTQDIATQAGQYDAVTIGTYEVPIWAQNGWLTNLDEYSGQGDWDADDILPPIKEALSHDGSLYGAPFYGESSFLMYRKDLFEQAGLTMPERPTWQQVQEFAAKLHNPAQNMAGICLRGLPGWGEVLAPLNTVILTYGGRWYDEEWNAHLTDPETKEAVQFYVDLLRNYGQPGAPNSGFSECLTSFGQGNAAMWYDATSAGESLENPAKSKVAGKVGYVFAPVNKTENSGWLWSWAFAIPETSQNKDATWQFVSWATSKEYEQLVGEKVGWASVPSGKRQSTYEIPEFKEAAAAFADQTLKSIESVNAQQPGMHPQPWVGVQYISIPEFQDLGTKVSQEISAAIAGQQTVDQALTKAQTYAEDTAKEGGYKK
jgi:sorbitol/mannitol transport system substrate-binding protein